MLTNALNKGNKPAVIVDHITVKELDMGTLVSELTVSFSIFLVDDILTIDPFLAMICGT